MRSQAVKGPGKLTKAVDIWSLGCLYSETAVWITNGYKGVIDYRRARRAETNEISNFRGGHCFHNGEKVLTAVLETHKIVTLDLNPVDYVTKDVLDSMVTEMLWETDRPS